MKSTKSGMEVLGTESQNSSEVTKSLSWPSWTMSPAVKAPRRSTPAGRTRGTAATTPPLTKTASLLTNEAAPGVGHAHVHRFHVNQAEFQQEKAVRTRETVGAAWALTLGNSTTTSRICSGAKANS